jgi:hypothetical protein
MPARWREARHRLRAEAASHRERRDRDSDAADPSDGTRENASTAKAPGKKVADDGD